MDDMYRGEEFYAAQSAELNWGDLETSFNKVKGPADIDLWVDSKEKTNLKDREQRVFPFTDEAEQLLRVAKEVVAENAGKKFTTVIDCFCGGGNSMLPILKTDLAQKGFGEDINPRAALLASQNAVLNNLNVRAKFYTNDVKDLATFLRTNHPDGPRLFIGNPPFALTVKRDISAQDSLPGNERDSILMRAGGINGLAITEKYIERALAAAQPGDVIIGLAYTRIAPDGKMELDDLIKTKIASTYKTFQFNGAQLIEGAKLWREPDGQKRLSNPMPMTEMNRKTNNLEEKKDYDRAAQTHIAQGFDRLGYVEYRIYIPNI